MIKNILAALGVVMLFGCAILASPALGQRQSLIDDERPPVRFTGDNATTVAFVNSSLIDRLCGMAPLGFKTLACTGERVMVLPNPCAYPDEDAYAHLACHELGHVNLWPADHGA